MGGRWVELGKKLGEFGAIGQYVFSTIVGIASVAGIMKLVGAMKELFTAGVEIQKLLFTFEVAIRGLQRAGLDTTIAGWTKQLGALKKEFPIFPRRAFIEAAGLAALMTREFGFTEEQMANIVRQSVILAQITGKDLTEAVRGVTYAIGSGYFESLQRAGINISRQIIAEEALARGYEGSYTSLSQNIRAMITYEIVQKNLSSIQEDAGAIVDTTAGQVMELNSAWIDLKDTIGLVIVESDALKDRIAFLAGAVGSITEAFILFDKVLSSISTEGVFARTEDVISPEALKRLQDAMVVMAKLPFGVGKGFEDYAEAIKEVRDAISDIVSEFPATGILGEEEVTFDPNKLINVGGLELTQAQIDEYIEILQAAQEKFAEIEEWGAEKTKDIQDKFMKDYEDDYEDHMQKLVDIKNDYNQKIADIGLKESRNAADEEVDYAYKVADAARQAAFRKEEAERRYREREINAEKRFQEKMRQLRENFLLNLEDAVRERDALQIIRLTRQYNLRKTQMEREEGLSGNERGRAFEEELRKIEQQRLERQRQLAIEHQRRLDDIALQAERERAQALVDFNRKEEDEKARWVEEAIARGEKFNQEMLDLQAEIDERNQKVLDGLLAQKSLTAEQLEQIGALYTHFYGPGGPIDAAVAYALARLAQVRAMNARINAFVNPNLQFGGNTFGDGQAEGGTIIANKPTTVTFGEAGAEIATFTPLNRAGVNTNQVTGSMPAGMGGGGGGGKYVVGISLSPGLEGKIVDQALGQASDIIFKLERARR